MSGSVLNHFDFVLKFKVKKDTIKDVDDIAWRIQGLKDKISDWVPDERGKKEALTALDGVAVHLNTAYTARAKSDKK